MDYFEVFHVGPHEVLEFERICQTGLQSLKVQANNGVIDLKETIRRRCIYWLDTQTQELRIGALYFRPERPPNTCNYIAVEVPGDSIVLNNRVESLGFGNYWGSGTTLAEFLGGNTLGKEYSAEIVIPNAPIIRNFRSINRAFY